MVSNILDDSLIINCLTNKKIIDTDKYTVLGFNIPGNGVKGQIFNKPQDFHTGDIASLFLLGLSNLKIKKLYALIGGSIGGGIAWEMAAISKDITKFLVPIAADWSRVNMRVLEESTETMQEIEEKSLSEHKADLYKRYKTNNT